VVNGFVIEVGIVAELAQDPRFTTDRALEQPDHFAHKILASHGGQLYFAGLRSQSSYIVVMFAAVSQRSAEARRYRDRGSDADPDRRLAAVALCRTMVVTWDLINRMRGEQCPEAFRFFSDVPEDNPWVVLASDG